MSAGESVRHGCDKFGRELGLLNNLFFGDFGNVGGAGATPWRRVCF